MHDFIVVGAGAAGCVVAARLTEDPDVQVLLLEAGRDGADDPRVSQPSRWPELLGSQYDWGFRTEPQDALGGRRLSWPRGKLLGGSTSINAMVYVRGHRTDFDGWQAYGGARWSSAGLEPAFKLFEESGRRERVMRQEHHHPLAEAFISAAIDVGLPHREYVDVGAEAGVGFYYVTQRDGRRMSAQAAYLEPARVRRNLTVVTGAQAARVVVQRDRAVGVVYRHDGEMRTAYANREVILAAGAVGSAHLLLLSGIGPADELVAAEVSPVHDLPGVGRNLHDHVQLSLTYKSTRSHSVAATSNLGEAGGFVCTGAGLVAPDVQLSFAPTMGLNDGGRAGEGFTIGPGVTRPRSRGCIRLRSSDFLEPPRIDPAYLSIEEDLATLAAGVRIACAIAEAAPLRKLRGDKLARPMSDHPRHIAEFVRAHAETQFHPVGSCRMGTDALAVVDSDLRVRGLSGLRVIDASVMPAVPTGNTQAATYAIAELGSAIIRGLSDARR